jgi:hypothetical protein
MRIPRRNTPPSSDAADRVITLSIAPGVPESIRPENVVGAEAESAAADAERQALLVELWSIPVKPTDRQPDRRLAEWAMRRSQDASHQPDRYRAVNQRTANPIAASLKGQ